MSTVMEIYAERRRGNGWVPIHIDSNGSPILAFDAGQNRVLFDVLAGGNRGRSWPTAIASARGIPPDCSEAIRRLASADQERDPTPNTGPFSWLLLREILDFDWDQQVLLGRTASLGTEVILGPSCDEEGLRQPPPGVFDLRKERLARWGLPGEVLSELRAYGNPEDVRLVFWFRR